MVMLEENSMFINLFGEDPHNLLSREGAPFSFLVSIGALYNNWDSLE